MLPRKFLAFAALFRAGVHREFLNVVLRVKNLYRKFTLDSSSLCDSVQSRDKLVMTAGFHSVGADREIESNWPWLGKEALEGNYHQSPWRGEQWKGSKLKW